MRQNITKHTKQSIACKLHCYKLALHTNQSIACPKSARLRIQIQLDCVHTDELKSSARLHMWTDFYFKSPVTRCKLSCNLFRNGVVPLYCVVCCMRSGHANRWETSYSHLRLQSSQLQQMFSDLHR